MPYHPNFTRLGVSPSVDQILDLLIESHPAPVVADSMIQACKGLVVFTKTRSCAFAPSISAYNELLDALQRGNEGNDADPDSSSWSLVARILCKSGKFEKVVRLIDKGIYNSEIYDLVVDFHSKTGDFEAAFHRLNEMKDRKLETSFVPVAQYLMGLAMSEVGRIDEATNMYGMMLKRGIKKKQLEKGRRTVDVMLEKGLLPDSVPCCLVIEYYCFNREMDRVVALHNKMEKVKFRWLNLIDSASFTIMIRELCRLKELRKAMKIHDEMLKMGPKPDKQPTFWVMRQSRSFEMGVR
ncbi:Tumor suppressor candidate, putative isoform 1 [Hibiscus syriacus]|uniref:Tumor suppressor candidate, putative isoform 1 n=1 Tax=Hibiscus syriacus TaxID=106335 RepID=A0A6A3CMW0_HIBSY|nr:Tumor suppressor candidate, putative isoform 1 [Hibiscus syriacus]